MSVLNELIQRIDNPELRAQIQSAVKKLTKQKKFGLVFEEHLPECTLMHDIPVKKGSKVSVRSKTPNEIYTVLAIENGLATCLARNGKDAFQFAVTDLITTAELGEPIYPYLKPLDSVCNAPDSNLWHTLIEADNYHALQLLEYLYAGQVDCIYIDPPYNTGARDWKYNNDYVDDNDSYRHSKWLSMMRKRLKIAKKLLNPKDSVLIVTIDEKEYLHLGCLLEEMFSEAKIQMVSSLMNRHGTSRSNEFSRTNEFIYFVMLGDYSISSIDSATYLSEGSGLHWHTLRRSTASNIRDEQHPNQFYPIYVDITTNTVKVVGECLPIDVDISTVPDMPNCETVFPLRDDGTEMMWGVSRGKFIDYLSKGYARVTKHTPNKPQKYVIQYLQTGVIEDIENGNIEITGHEYDGSVIGVYKIGKATIPSTLWTYDHHDARDYGTKILKKVLGETRFDFPKSLYAVKDCLKLFTAEKPDALIVDFFAGSGTTLHAVNLLNAEDGGSRRCIMVTNNEVSADEAKALSDSGYHPGDEEWEKLGIARYVTWPRTVCSIKGVDVNGDELRGNYGCEIEKMIEVDGEITDPDTGKKLRGTFYKKVKEAIYPTLSRIKMADGFAANVEYFKLGFLDKTKVSLGMQFRELLPTLWMKAGAIGKCPVIESIVPDMMILPDNKMAILNNENLFCEFSEQLAQYPEIDVVFLVTDYESSFVSMIQELGNKTTYQLYRDYLDHFRINAGRSSR